MSTPTLAFTTTDTPPERAVLAVDAGLDLHNQAAAPLSDVRPLAAFATDPTGRVVGGAVGRTWGRCCELLQLWVAAVQRVNGVGSRLRQEFEARGRQRGCDVFYLTTLSFQAPGFYRKRVVEMEQHSPGLRRAGRDLGLPERDHQVPDAQDHHPSLRRRRRDGNSVGRMTMHEGSCHCGAMRMTLLSGPAGREVRPRPAR